MTLEEMDVWPCIVCGRPGGRSIVTKDGFAGDYGMVHRTCFRRHRRTANDGASGSR